MLNNVSFVNISKIFFYLFIFTIFFPIRYVFPTFSSYQTGLFSDFTTISLYLSDIFLIITWFFLILSRGKAILHVIFWKNPLFLLILWAFLSFLANFNENWGISLFYLIKLVELIVAYETCGMLYDNKAINKPFIWFVILLGTFQSLLALFQFYSQHPLGLSSLGEQQIYPYLKGVAKIVSGGTEYIRGYGTFPHPNVLSAFLVFNIFLIIYKFLRLKSKSFLFLAGLLLVINIFCLAVTFSRAGYLALLLGLLFIGLYITLNGKKLQFREVILSKFKLFSLFGIILIAFIGTFFLFKPFLLSRTTFNDTATIERKTYNQIGLHMLKDNPLVGIGPNQSVLHMQQYSPVRLWPWQIQPIHNYFILSGTELGIVGVLLLLFIFLKHLYGLLKNINTSFSALLLFTLLVVVVILMQFDHYFYTLQQTQMLLWALLGISSSFMQNKNTPTREGVGE